MLLFLKRVLYFLTVMTGISIILSICGIYVNPNQFPLLAFFSISYPILFTAMLGFSLTLIFINMKWFYVSAGLTILSSIYLPRYYQVNVFPHQVPQNSLNVMSYNVRLFNLYDWRNNIEVRNSIFNLLKKESPDIACFQEFYHQKNSIKFPTKDTLLQFMPWKYYHEKYTHEMHYDQYFGVATFSKYPIVYQGEIPFENDDNNFCIYSDIVKNQDTLRILNAHIGSIRFKKKDYEFFGDESKIHPDGQGQNRILARMYEAFKNRGEQIDAIYKELNKSPYPVVLCLDMNDTPMSYAYQTISTRLKDAFKESGSGTGATYIGKVPSFRIDYIFHSQDLKSGNFVTHKEELSDHRAISCSIY